MNPLYNQLNPNPAPDILSRFDEFRKTFKGNPREIVQNMLNSGRISQSQVNQYAQQANDLYRRIYGK